jgi:peptide deformylase
MDDFVLDITGSTKIANSNTRVKFVGSNSYEYEIYPLVDEYDPVLKQQAEFFNFDKPVVNPVYLAFSMLETMKKKFGIGLAAPQVGISTRMFVMGSEGGVGYTIFNPVVLETKGEVKMEEGCLSYPGLYLPIKRPEEITVSYYDVNVNQIEKKFSGLTARVFLHELDHLDGICFTSLVSPIILDRCKRKVKKNLKLLKLQREEMAKKEIIAKAMKNLYDKGNTALTINEE